MKLLSFITALLPEAFFSKLCLHDFAANNDSSPKLLISSGTDLFLLYCTKQLKLYANIWKLGDTPAGSGKNWISGSSHPDHSSFCRAVIISGLYSAGTVLICKLK
ncbi:hypothetical protein AMECASPLE_030455 [Ameca splendens]|uniref:Uncharacterized protein n=1 Tax=Ameca splendens TaxID=208324 RepID=A0ABV0Y6K6_9TELE